ncbi:DUF1801 domain-containing protein [Demequina sp. B12]|uniref:DUF1801 domain-containing protein n=1 Tax=Demequina sp. B12 TaxID=2992757 RepID=UPI00237BF190|nr:DUF1801 domain-containing protein [Demequina sp. B12]MDE0573279.1 DUF1801 domain-containing protein [Demequina sp. B12]
MERTSESVEDFLRGGDADDPAMTLTAVDEVIVRALPDATRVLWRGTFWGGTEQAIVGYGAISQPRPKGPDVEWFLIGLARQKRHVSLYVNAAEGKRYLSAAYGPRLGKVKVGAAAVNFGSVRDLDLEVLAELVSHAGRVQAYS